MGVHSADFSDDLPVNQEQSESKAYESEVLVLPEYLIAAGTMVGEHTRENSDAFNINTLNTMPGMPKVLAVLCDGMTGEKFEEIHHAGRIAARYFADNFHRAFYSMQANKEMLQLPPEKSELDKETRKNDHPRRNLLHLLNDLVSKFINGFDITSDTVSFFQKRNHAVLKQYTDLFLKNGYSVATDLIEIYEAKHKSKPSKEEIKSYFGSLNRDQIREMFFESEEYMSAIMAMVRSIQALCEKLSYEASFLALKEIEGFNNSLKEHRYVSSLCTFSTVIELQDEYLFISIGDSPVFMARSEGFHTDECTHNHSHGSILNSAVGAQFEIDDSSAFFPAKIHIKRIPKFLSKDSFIVLASDGVYIKSDASSLECAYKTVRDNNGFESAEKLVESIIIHGLNLDPEMTAHPDDKTVIAIRLHAPIGTTDIQTESLARELIPDSGIIRIVSEVREEMYHRQIPLEPV